MKGEIIVNDQLSKKFNLGAGEFSMEQFEVSEVDHV